MSKDKFKDLRREAEEQIAARESQIETMEQTDLKKLAHELTVHQIELEIQNEELRQSRTQAEEALTGILIFMTSRQSVTSRLMNIVV
jgi:replicative superfamily II helicase